MGSSPETLQPSHASDEPVSISGFLFGFLLVGLDVYDDFGEALFDA